MTMNVTLKVYPRTQQVLQAIGPQLKKRHLKQMTKKDAVGDQIVLFANPKRKRKRTSHSIRRHHQKYKNHRPKDPIFESKHDISQTAMGSRNGET